MIIKKKRVKHPVKSTFSFELSEEEAIGIVNELGEFKCDMDYNRIIPIPKNYWARLFMTLSDALQDLDIIPMTEGRKKGKESRPRLENDDIIVKENDVEDLKNEPKEGNDEDS